MPRSPRFDWIGLLRKAALAFCKEDFNVATSGPSKSPNARNAPSNFETRWFAPSCPRRGLELVVRELLGERWRNANGPLAHSAPNHSQLASHVATSPTLVVARAQSGTTWWERPSKTIPCASWHG